MKKFNFYFNVSNGHLVQVSRFRFYLRFWIHFPITGYRLIILRNFTGCPVDLVLTWMPVLINKFTL